MKSFEFLSQLETLDAAMKTENLYIHAGKGTQLFCQSWQPDTPPKATLFIVHGLGEHLGRYEEMALSMVERGIGVFAFDHRGHGGSDGKKGHAASVEQLIEDTEFALMKCRSLFLETPICIYGHSMGGQIAASFLKKIKSKELSRAIISSAWFELVSPPPPWQIKMIKQLKKIIPNLTLSNRLDPDLISSVTEEVALYKNDPKIHDRISFALFKALYTNGLKLLSENKLAKVPVLLCHGDGDRITAHTASERYAVNLGEKATFKNWPGSYHEPHHDKDKSKVIELYADWILGKL